MIFASMQEFYVAEASFKFVISRTSKNFQNKKFIGVSYAIFFI